MSKHLSARDLDARALGALSPEEAARAALHLSACSRCRADAEALDASRGQFASSVLPRTLPAIRERLGARRRPWRRLWLAVPVAALAAVLLLLIVPRGIAISPGGDDDLRIKGDVSLQVVAQRGGETWVVDGRPLVAGDAIRFVVVPAGATHVIVASVDGAGAATIYHPYGGAASAPLAPGPRLELPGSIVLDQAPGPERIFALFSRAPLAAADVRAALEAAGARGPEAIRAANRLDLPCDGQASVMFEKAAAAP